MTGATLSCTLCQVPPDDSDVERVMKNCNLLDGDACSACKANIALEAKISAARKSLIELIKQRPKMRERVNQNHDTLTNSIPLELVGSIFHFCVSTRWKFEELEQLSIRRPGSLHRRGVLGRPISLGRICKTWRNIAWSMKPLWTAFTLHINKNRIYPNDLALTKEWLERAGQLPLSLHILSDGLSLPKHHAEQAKQLIAVVNERSNQWEHLDISAPSSLISRLKGSPGGAPNLQTLKIVSSSFESGNGKLALMNAMPRPSRLILNGFPLSRVHIEWTHITHVCINSFRPDESIELLRRATNLIYYKIDSELIHSQRQQTFPMPDEPILHRTLESCSIFMVPTQTPEITTFFKSLIFPNLKHLYIECILTRGHLPDQPSWAPMVPLILNSSPSLISLAIYYLGPHSLSEFVMPILKRTPLLRDLEIVAPFPEEWDGEECELFRLLANTSSSNDAHNNFLPNLQSITFKLCYNEQWLDRFWNSIPRIFGPVSDIHSRHRPLKTLRVRTYGVIESPDVVLQLLRLRQEGIVLDIKDIQGLLTTDVLEKSIEFHGLSE